ncbi:MAG: hypothetical protein H0W44_10390 [Gammaproteobacteria bacterium]|nr:hypothetical protein [Gammaproteobacteria bacterium]
MAATSDKLESGLSAAEKARAHQAAAQASQDSWVMGAGIYIFAIVVLSALYIGWQNRDEYYIHAEYGLGYALGIIGLTTMILLLLYPLRKRWSVIRDWGQVKYWFRIHMIMGILGPTAIIFHTNFHVGSTNSMVALTSMLLVVGSGLVGRYIYRKIHHGLYGRKITLKELNDEQQDARTEFDLVIKLVPTVQGRMTTLEAMSLAPVHGSVEGFMRMYRVHVEAKKIYVLAQQQIGDALEHEASKHGWNKAMQKDYGRKALIYCRHYLLTLVRITEFGLYERLFALWHVVHLPLFILLAFSAVFHVYAVHVY